MGCWRAGSPFWQPHPHFFFSMPLVHTGHTKAIWEISFSFGAWFLSFSFLGFTRGPSPHTPPTALPAFSFTRPPFRWHEFHLRQPRPPGHSACLSNWGLAGHLGGSWGCCVVLKDGPQGVFGGNCWGGLRRPPVVLVLLPGSPCPDLPGQHQPIQTRVCAQVRGAHRGILPSEWGA